MKFPGQKKKKPESFSEKWNFNPPNPNGGGPVIKDSGLSYMSAAVDNHLLSDEFVIQIIADSEFFTSRAVVEVWKQGNKINKQYSKSAGNELITITGVYGGFRRPDGRNWLGFHDGVSNLTSSERSYVIPISSHHLKIQDEWTINGTYLAFMRIKVDLEKWVDIQVDEQEKIIGRDKLTGCPLIRIGSEGKPFKDPNCPVLERQRLLIVQRKIFVTIPTTRNIKIKFYFNHILRVHGQ